MVESLASTSREHRYTDVGNLLTGSAPLTREGRKPTVNQLLHGYTSWTEHQDRRAGRPLGQPSAAPLNKAVPTATGGRKGQEFSTAVAGAIGPEKLSDADLSARIKRMDFVMNALGLLLQKHAVTHEDCVDLVQSAIKAGVVPATEAAEILGSLPRDPAALRGQMEHRRKIAMHALVHLGGERQRRTNPRAGGRE